ncbi:hypothetical protein M3Y96_00033500 [Aphelenchoides besseyi]|nr:hypothetical protein M3Y96_00033500 [Aphelenchoides besseyi]
MSSTSKTSSECVIPSPSTSPSTTTEFSSFTPRRRLPDPPTITNAVPFVSSAPLAVQPVIRRSSSPRILPTPPPQSISPIAITNVNVSASFSPSPSPPAMLERRPSSGRKLPPEPSQQPNPSVPLSSALPPPNPNSNLQRSASARTNNVNRAQLPPAAPRSSTSSTTTTMNRLIPEPLSSAAANGNNPISGASSAPQSPRGNLSRGSMSEISVGYSGGRKFSTDIGRDSLSRNGSMAHLLEQQHLLRREFTATPDSMVAHSNASSLSPSMEQLNCAISSKSSSDGDDPSNHGLDPALYQPQTPTNSTTDDVPIGSNSHGSSTALSQSTAVSAVNNENEPRPKGLGLIYCTIQLFPARKRLRAVVLKIEGLAGELRPEFEIQPFCKVNVIPGKQKQAQISFVKRGRDVVFNQEFFFDGISSEDLESKSLFVEVCHQSSQKLQKDLVIGEICVPLKDLNQLQSSHKKEVRIIEELKHRPNTKKLGKLYITTSIDKDARLTINIIKVDSLPRFIFGAPGTVKQLMFKQILFLDVCVRITTSQGNGNAQTKSSRVLKKTCSAVFNEAVMFLISTKKSDLLNTKITISVHDTSRSVTGDDVIGSVYLGQLAVDKSEIEQWKNTMEHIGKEYKGSHQLKTPNQGAPDVHVEMPDEDEEDEAYG